jgi:hypothetical protein
MKHLIIISLLFFLATSCKKETSVVIQAKDYITGDGSAYAGQEYAVSESWTPFFETKSKIVATGFLDANGKASFNLKMKNNRKYVMGVSQPDNICYGGLVQHYLEHEKNNTVIFKYAKCGYLDIKSNNINCEGPNDEFRFRFYYSSNPDIYIYIYIYIYIKDLVRFRNGIIKLFLVAKIIQMLNLFIEMYLMVAIQ